MPYLLNSRIGTTLCPVCDSDFYLIDANVHITTIFENPSVYRKACPDTAGTCKSDTSIIISESNLDGNGLDMRHHCIPVRVTLPALVQTV